jgi:hypothetical protein
MTFARIRALIFVTVLFVIAGIVVAMAISRDSQNHIAQAAGCASGLVPVSTAMPERNQVTINVINGTNTVGLADQVATELKFRGYVIGKESTAPKPVNQIAVITYGPGGLGAAWLVSANFLVDGAELHFDIKRKGADVDLTLGTQFQQLATVTEVNQTIAANGLPSPPPGTCAH